jgi:hypothetical protein
VLVHSSSCAPNPLAWACRPPFAARLALRPFDLAQDRPHRLFAHRHRSWWGKRGGGQPALSADVPSVVEGALVCKHPRQGIIWTSRRFYIVGMVRKVLRISRSR